MFVSHLGRGEPRCWDFFDWPKGKIWEGSVQTAEEHGKHSADLLFEKLLMSVFCRNRLTPPRSSGVAYTCIEQTRTGSRTFDKSFALYFDRNTLYYDC